MIRTLDADEMNYVSGGLVEPKKPEPLPKEEEPEERIRAFDLYEIQWAFPSFSGGVHSGSSFSEAVGNTFARESEISTSEEERPRPIATPSSHIVRTQSQERKIPELDIAPVYLERFLSPNLRRYLVRF